MGDRSEPVAAGKPVRPADLDGEAAAHWEQVVGLIDPNCLGRLDAIALAEMCRLWARYRKLEKLWDEHLLDKDVRCACTACYDRWERMAGKFGMTPGDRTKISTGGGDKPAKCVASRSRTA